MRTILTTGLALAAAAAVTISAQQPPPSGGITWADLQSGLKDPARWLTFSGDYTGQRHSPLTQITPANVASLQPQWTFQTDTLGRFETTSLLIDNVLYVTGPQNVAWALDAKTGRQIWRYRRELPTSGLTACCGLVNKGFGVLGDKLFMVTLDAHLLALDMKTGRIAWDIVLEDYRKGYAATLAPLVIKDKVIVGVAGGEYGIRGFIDAYDAQSGKRAWRFYTVPGPGDPGNETWAGDSWQRGGASVWTTGTYDPESNLTFWGIGNPSPDYHSESRAGDNLYSASLVALDADTGTLKWHYQFTPHDVHDWDATQVPVLADLTINGRPRKVIMTANRNGFYYTIDRTNGKVIVAKPFVQVNWAREIGADGRPVLVPGHTPDEKGEMTCPDLVGGANFQPPSFDPATGLFYITARETCATFYAWKPDYSAGDSFTGGATQRSNLADGSKAHGALRAIDPKTGERKWEFKYLTPSLSGVLTTASGVLFTGDAEGNLFAVESGTGKLLWHYQMGSALHGTAPTTYMLDGRQYLLVPSGTTLTAWALPVRASSTR
jgi:alcohol dehydrogenase (cytochrome c)